MASPDYATDLDDFLKVVDRLPFLGSLKRDLTTLRRLLYDRRPPRIAALRAPDSGATALANALLGAHALGPDAVAPVPEAGSWVTIDADGRRMQWLELPLDADVETLRDLARPAFEEHRPDLVLLVVPLGHHEWAQPLAKEAVPAVRALLSEGDDKAPAVVVVMSQAERAEPVELKTPPYDAAKTQAIGLALADLRKALASLKLDEGAFLAVAAPPSGAIQDRPVRWHVEELSDAIIPRLPESAQLEAVRALAVTREGRREVARRLVNAASAIGITVGLAPVPFADVFALLPLQVGMVTGVAYLSGRPWDRSAALEYLASLGVTGGAGLGLRWSARQLLKLVPGAGSLISAGFAGAGTLAIGRGAIAYFIDGPGVLSQRRELRAENPRA